MVIKNGVLQSPVEDKTMRCERCGKDTTGNVKSFFDMSHICPECEARERKHPDYEKACAAEAEAVRRGLVNFPGIGRPHDLDS